MSQVPDQDYDVAQLSGLFKALADPARLRIVGLLAERRRCGRELAHELRLSAPTVSHHIKLLRGVGLITQHRERPYTFYELDDKAMAECAAIVGDREVFRQVASSSGISEDKRKVLRAYFEGSQLVAIPADADARTEVFAEVLRRLPRRRDYQPAELVDFLGAMFPESAKLLDALIGAELIALDDGRYVLSERGREAVAE